MKKVVLLLAMASLGLQAQVGIGTETPNAKAALDVTATDKGVLIPRMTTTQRTAMFPTADATAAGMQVYDTTTKSFWFYDGTNWVAGNGGGDTTNDAWKNNTTTNVVELATKADGTTARDAGSYFKVADNGKIEMGTSDAPGEFALTFESTSGNYDFKGSSSGQIIIRDLDATKDVDGQYSVLSFRSGIADSTGDKRLGSVGFATGAQELGLNNKNTGSGASTSLRTLGGGLELQRDGKVWISSVEGAPTAKLDIAGDVRVRTLPTAVATDVLVTADPTTGLLKKAGTLGSVIANADTTIDAWKNNTSLNAVDLATKSDGTTARDAGTEFQVFDDGSVRMYSTSLSEYGLYAKSKKGEYLLEGDTRSYLKIADKDATINVDGMEAIVSFLDKSNNTLGGVGFATGGQSLGLINNNTGTTADLTLGTAGGILKLERNGNVKIGNPTATAKLNVEGYIKLGSADTTGDATPQAGMLRYNITTDKFQGYARDIDPATAGDQPGWVDLN